MKLGFSSGKKHLEALPPTQASLYQHIRRAVLQATQATLVYMDIPDFQEWGWHKDRNDRNGYVTGQYSQIAVKPVQSYCSADA